jgi:hypothetical protein
MSLTPGSHCGAYEIVALLGAGGMGEVYRARDPKLGRQVAIKVLGADALANPAAVRRFQHEARAASALNHPGIVTVHDIGEFHGQFFIVMELVEGTTLRQLLGRGRLLLRKTLQIASQLADALAKAHDAGIVHCDLKPENVMLTGDGHVKIVDLEGRATMLSGGWRTIRGLDWSPSGDEIWITASERGRMSSLYAVSLSGERRLLFHAPGDIMLFDLFRDHRALLVTTEPRTDMIWSSGREERDLSWLDWSTAADLSADGKNVLFYEWGEGVGASPSVYIRSVDGSDPVRLGAGKALALSPDGSRALALQEGSQPQLPSHDCETIGEAAPGQKRLALMTGVNVRRLLDPLIPNAYVHLRYGYHFVQPFRGIGLDRSSAELEVGYALAPTVTIRAVGSWMETHGGIGSTKRWIWTRKIRCCFSSTTGCLPAGIGASAAARRSRSPTRSISTRASRRISPVARPDMVPA